MQRRKRKYGLGAAPPFPGRLARHLRSGYLVMAESLRGLAIKLGIDADGLERTVAKFNPDAARGADPAFGKGSDAYNRSNGDPSHAPNPNLAALTQPPFYAVRLVPGDLGTFAGLATDQDARVLDHAAKPIVGLYAVGNDMASPAGGSYPAAGTAIGAAMTFAYRSARHAASRRSAKEADGNTQECVA